MSTAELRQQRKKLIEDSRVILNKADAEKRELTTEERAEYDRMDSDIEKLDDKIEREEKLEEREKSLGEFVGEKRTTIGGDNKPEDRGSKGPEKLQRDAFTKFFKDGFASLSREEARALSAGTGSKGGYITAPEVIVNEILKNVDNLVYIRQKARKFTCPRGGTLGVPSLDARASAFTRGSEISEAPENDTIAFGKRELKPIEFKSLFKVSEKLLEAATINVEAFLKSEIAYALAISEEQEFMTGTGAGQALGLFTAHSDGISTGRDVSTGNTTTAVTFDGLIEAQESVKDNYQAGCEWVGSRALRKMVRKLKDQQNQYIWEASTQVGAPALLLGKPFTASEYTPATFTAGLYVGMYGDFSNYWIADSVDLQILALNELYAATFQKGFRCLTEMDAAPAKEEAFARIKLAAS